MDNVKYEQHRDALVAACNTIKNYYELTTKVTAPLESMGRSSSHTYLHLCTYMITCSSRSVSEVRALSTLR